MAGPVNNGDINSPLPLITGTLERANGPCGPADLGGAADTLAKNILYDDKLEPQHQTGKGPELRISGICSVPGANAASRNTVG